MSESTRRRFLRNISLGLGTATLADPAALLSKARSLTPFESGAGTLPCDRENLSPTIDFRYSPLSWQTAFCFPDDHYKSLVGEHGDLRYGHPGQGAGIEAFPEVVEFSLLGMEADEVRWQRLEGPGIPIIHTRIDRPEAFLQLTTFASWRASEGRVDNVILEVEPRTSHTRTAVPVMVLRTQREIELQECAGFTLLRLGDATAPPFLLVDVPLSLQEDGIVYRSYVLKADIATEGRPARCLFRFPQEGQEIDKLKAGLEAPDRLLAEARASWQNWKPFEGNVSWQLTGRDGEFLVACARNLQQAREEKRRKDYVSGGADGLPRSLGRGWELHLGGRSLSWL